MIKRKLIVGAAILAFGAASFGQQELNRDAVQSELLRARAAGEIAPAGEAWDGSVDATGNSGLYGRRFAEPGMSRDAVVAETSRARAAGEMSSGEGWDGSFQSSIRAIAGVYGRAFYGAGSGQVDRAEVARGGAELAQQQHDYVGGN